MQVALPSFDAHNTTPHHTTQEAVQQLFYSAQLLVIQLSCQLYIQPYLSHLSICLVSMALQAGFVGTYHKYLQLADIPVPLSLPYKMQQQSSISIPSLQDAVVVINIYPFPTRCSSSHQYLSIATEVRHTLQQFLIDFELVTQLEICDDTIIMYIPTTFQ